MLAGCAMKRTLQIAAIAVMAAFLAAGCARMPKPERSAKVIKSFFKKYGKKYPTTAYGEYGVKEIDITDQSEIHKHLVAVESFITLGDGQVQRIYATLEKGPLGWRFISWELASK